MSTLDQPGPPVLGRRRGQRSELARLGRHPVPERGGEHRGVRHRRARGAAMRMRRRRARSSSPTTTPRTAAPSSPTRAGARVVHEPRRGYGSAYLAGFAAARGRYIVMADADLTYDFNEIPRFVEELDEGAELVIGDRMDNIQPGAMPWLHRYVGNPVLTGLLNLFFRTGVQRRPLRHARAAPRRAAAAGPAHDRHGVRLGDGHPRVEGEAATSPSSRSSTTRAAARASCRASATAGATCASCSSTARPTCSSSRARCCWRSAR